ncbi:alpha/beta fold hydrolase [Nocardioides sp. J2M5]|uniref:alpha/beta fold hydrolase n=1 Tax=Nocardioides TaxID=1839 RepID=UPI001BABE58F|nr:MULTISPECIES: alpha/beta fold hydrolase [Nocardioides]MBS2937961.1 alpha/beta fold hydrolase [Nocardioides palaemonis]
MQLVDEDAREVRVGEHAVVVSVRKTGGVGSRGLPLLMCHGVGLDQAKWGEFREQIPRTTIAFDVQPEHLGRWPTVMGYARFVSRVMDRLGVQRFDVLGLSWGGVTAQQLALTHPRRVRRVVLASTSPGFLSVPVAPATVASFWRPDRSEANREVLVRRVYGGDFVDDPELLKRLGLVREVDAGAYRRQLLALVGWTSVPFLPLLAQRTLIMHGDDDPVFSVHNARLMHLLAPRSTLEVVPHGGHMFLLSRPESSARAVTDFLEADGRGHRA